jgi:hypothetical protein
VATVPYRDPPSRSGPATLLYYYWDGYPVWTIAYSLGLALALVVGLAPRLTDTRMSRVSCETRESTGTVRCIFERSSALAKWAPEVIDGIFLYQGDQKLLAEAHGGDDEGTDRTVTIFLSPREGAAGELVRTRQLTMPDTESANRLRQFLANRLGPKFDASFERPWLLLAVGFVFAAWLVRGAAIAPSRSRYHVQVEPAGPSLLVRFRNATDTIPLDRIRRVVLETDDRGRSKVALELTDGTTAPLSPKSSKGSTHAAFASRLEAALAAARKGG